MDSSNSPYNFTGDITIGNGVTLTIQPGVDVLENGNAMIVEGTLQAVGESNGGNIQFDTSVLAGSAYGIINFTSSSENSIIENASLNSFLIYVTDSSPKINHDEFGGAISIMGGSPTVSDCSLDTGGFTALGSTITIIGGSATIQNNTFNRYLAVPSAISLGGTNDATVLDNNFYGDYSEAAVVINSGSPLIERNLVSPNVQSQNGQNSATGIAIYGNTSPVIANNTVAENSVGLNIYDSDGSSSLTIAYNNFEQNSQYNIYLGQQGNYSSTAGNIDAINNWWGTTDISTINQTIYDFKDNYNVGTVTFTPILTSPNTEAMPDPNAPTPTPNPSQATNPPTQSTASPSQPTDSPTSSASQNSTATFPLSQTGLLTMIAVLASGDSWISSCCGCSLA